MPKRAQLLYALQRIDTQLARKKRRYREIEAHLGEDEVIRETREALEAAQAELRQWRARLRDHELEVEGVSAKIRETEDRLYGGKVTDPKELTDLQHESEYLARRKEALEEKEIEEMVTVEQLTAKAATAQERWTVIEATWRTENTELSKESETLRSELSTLLGKRKALVKHVAKDDLAEYDAIRRLRKGTAVVAVRDGACRVCHVEVPQRDLERAQGTDQIYYCSGCERILYVPED